MPKKALPVVTVRLEKIVGGGQTLGTLEDGRKVFVWGGLPDEIVEVQLTKKKSKMAEGYVVSVMTPSSERIEPRDPDSYPSTSPWQIMSPETENKYKTALIDEAFALHDMTIAGKREPIYYDERDYGYRNKVEFSFYYDAETEKLSLAFFRRGSHGKIPVNGTSLAKPEINIAGKRILNLLNSKSVNGFDLKTLLIRSNMSGDVIAQLYVKNEDFIELSDVDFGNLNLAGLDVIFSNPKSPASIITKRLQHFGANNLSDEVMGIGFNYATEGFFQINLPVYEQALKDIKEFVSDKPLVDLYSGVGTIGLTVTHRDTPLKLVEINDSAVDEMKHNILALKRTNAEAILAASENTLEYINNESQIIVDPPRAGLHEDVVNKLLEATPSRIIYLSCNPVTQARDVKMLSDKYQIIFSRGYNFFPHTPHIENLVVLDLVK